MGGAVSKYDVVVKGDPENKKLGDCPFCQRVIITLEAKKIRYDLTYVDLNNKPDWLNKISGGKVPVLRNEEKKLVLPDSDAIAEYLEKEHLRHPMKSDAPDTL